MDIESKMARTYFWDTVYGLTICYSRMPRWSYSCEVMPWEKKHHLLRILTHTTYLCWGQHQCNSSNHRQFPPVACPLVALARGTSCATKVRHREAWIVLHHVCPEVCS
jgi:hypothetical protein